ncbi:MULTISPECIES: hypothetical protein [Maribellus]|uniref:Uncharacterized protein n=1 Tax=Maribellus comscasis TaxID=2681766 RepID=A0A6I6JL53_9BACT|nr:MULTISPECIES: hypothetical protein [Maribellus]MCG6187375.1 hypothetical protein [Maribellus maritimus]QGY43526.1 hypothetical protein GM418_07585 [Maribellus comscasis]
MESIKGGGHNNSCRFLGGVWLTGLLSVGLTGGMGIGIATGAWAGAVVYGCFD